MSRVVERMSVPQRPPVPARRQLQSHWKAEGSLLWVESTSCGLGGTKKVKKLMKEMVEAKQQWRLKGSSWLR